MYKTIMLEVYEKDAERIEDKIDSALHDENILVKSIRDSAILYKHSMKIEFLHADKHEVDEIISTLFNTHQMRIVNKDMYVHSYNNNLVLTFDAIATEDSVNFEDIVLDELKAREVDCENVDHICIRR